VRGFLSRPPKEPKPGLHGVPPASAPFTGETVNASGTAGRKRCRRRWAGTDAAVGAGILVGERWRNGPPIVASSHGYASHLVSWREPTIVSDT